MIDQLLIDKKDFSGKKFYKEDFSGLKLQHANFSMTTCIECNFTDTDLKFANFRGANCMGSNFTRTNLCRVNMADCILEHTIFDPRDAFGLIITLRCETFSGMKMGRTWRNVWHFIPALTDIATEEESKLIEFLTPKLWEKFKMVFNRRIV
jgi:uncharacterized protein YjbI with pentapeptide repeats